MAGAEENYMKNRRKHIPSLGNSPFEEVEVVDQDDLGTRDRQVLEKAEAVIEAGSKTFMDVAQALMEIRDYKDGLLYKQKYGTWDAYCEERWDFGRAYASRLTKAAEIVGMLPMGNISAVTERQIRPLGKLTSEALRRRAWELAIEDAGEGPVFTRHVEKAVRALVEKEGLPAAKRSTPMSYRIDAEELKAAQTVLERLRKLCKDAPKAKAFLKLIDELGSLLPGR